MADFELRLGVYYHVPVLSKTDGIYLPGYFGCFAESLASYCSEVIGFFYNAKPGQRTLCDYRITAANVSVVSLGLPTSAVHTTLFPGQYTRRMKAVLPQLDVLLLRGPSALLPPLALSVGSVPLVLMVVGDYLAGIDFSPQPRWRKELIRLWASWNTWGQLRAAQKALTLVNSEKLYQTLQGKVPVLRRIRTTTLSQKDFYQREDTCLEDPVHLLFSGRLSISKGVIDIVLAVSQLVVLDHDVMLDLVGWPEPGEEDIIEHIETLAIQNGIAGRINYFGYKPLGPELFDCYKKADIFVIASKSDFEGFPRTIWEAMSQSLPVIATCVGSIPAFAEGAIELVKPNQPMAIAEAVERLITMPELRKRYIQRGMTLARQNTLEIRSREMIQEIESWLRK